MKRVFTPQNTLMTNLDLFAFVNAFLFMMMSVFVYYDRFIAYRGSANLHEFFFYAIVIFLVICYTWLKFRHFDVRLSILMLIEITIILHFAGAFVQIDGSRLYDFRFFDIRYDKFVHLINSMIATVVVLYLLHNNHIKTTKLILTAIVLSVLGVGAVIEILEFIVTLTVPHNGVGDYTNNMLDMVANFIGSLIVISFYNVQKRSEKSWLSF